MINFFLKTLSLISVYWLTNLPVLAAQLPNPLGGKDFISPQQITANIIRAMLGVTGILATLVFVWGGLLWTSSGGSKEKIKKGKDAMIWAMIGLILSFASYSLINSLIKLISF